MFFYSADVLSCQGFYGYLFIICGDTEPLWCRVFAGRQFLRVKNRQREAGKAIIYYWLKSEAARQISEITLALMWSQSCNQTKVRLKSGFEILFHVHGLPNYNRYLIRFRIRTYILIRSRLYLRLYPQTPIVPLSQSLSNHPFFILATFMLSKSF